MKNGDSFNEFLSSVIDFPGMDENTRLLASRIRNDKDFYISYLQLTTILLIRFLEKLNEIREERTDS